MQLLRRVRLLKLEHDPALTDSLALLQSKMRHITGKICVYDVMEMAQILLLYRVCFAGVQHQEEAIIKLLEEKNVTKLSDLLSGRGQGKLVMAAPSPEAMADWLEVLQQVCSKKIALPSARAATNNKPFSAPTPVEEEELECMTVLKAGSLEKAARGNEGVLRNWRLRYFVLQGDEMSYFTKLGGEKKGAIRVTGGAVRALPLSESSGHHNCIELQEGRDLSVIDPELLGEVRKQVNIFRREQLEEELARGIATGTEERLMAALESASSFGISLDGELVAQARSVLMREQHKKLKLDLREALVTLPRRRMQELIRTAKRVRLDPNNAFLRRAILHADKSDVELTLLRARSSMGRVEDAVFKRAVTSVQQLDAKRLSVREKYLLVAILLQWTGYTILRTLVQGSMGAQHCIHVLNQVLASTIVYYIETEPMQLARTVLEGLQSCLDGSEMDSFLADKPTRHLPGGVSMANLSLQFQGANNAITFSLERFPQLRRSTSDSSTPSKAAKGGLFGFLGGSKKKLEEDTGAAAAATTSLTFTTESITAPLSIVGRTVDSKVTELFGGLQVVMMDRPLAQFSASQVKARHSFFSRADVSSICGDLVTCGVTTPSLRDELYLHVCKQINKNPKPLSRYYGWCVFNIYLNCFPPSFGLLPYLKNFVAESLVFESKQSSGSASGRAIVQQSAKRRFSVARGGNEETNMGTSKLVSYATKLIGGIERSYARGIEGAVFQPTNRVIAEFLNGAELEFEVVTMTGSVYRLCLAPRDIDSPLSLLYALYKQLATGLSAPSQADYSSFFEQPDLQKSSALAPATQVGGSDSITNASVTDILLRTFRSHKA